MWIALFGGSLNGNCGHEWNRLGRERWKATNCFPFNYTILASAFIAIVIQPKWRNKIRFLEIAIEIQKSSPSCAIFVPFLFQLTSIFFLAFRFRRTFHFVCARVKTSPYGHKKQLINMQRNSLGFDVKWPAYLLLLFELFNGQGFNLYEASD